MCEVRLNDNIKRTSGINLEGSSLIRSSQKVWDPPKKLSNCAYLYIIFLKIPFPSLLKTENAFACLCLCRCSDFFSEEKDMCMSNSSAGKCTKSMNTVKKTI